MKIFIMLFLSFQANANDLLDKKLLDRVKKYSNYYDVIGDLSVISDLSERENGRGRFRLVEDKLVILFDSPKTKHYSIWSNITVRGPDLCTQQEFVTRALYLKKNKNVNLSCSPNFKVKLVDVKKNSNILILPKNYELGGKENEVIKKVRSYKLPIKKSGSLGFAWSLHFGSSLLRTLINLSSKEGRKLVKNYNIKNFKELEDSKWSVILKPKTIETNVLINKIKVEGGPQFINKVTFYHPGGKRSEYSFKINKLQKYK